MAFRRCRRLHDLVLNEDLQELGWLCLWESGISDLHLPPHVKAKLKWLGIGVTELKVANIPDGTEAIYDR